MPTCSPPAAAAAAAAAAASPELPNKGGEGGGALVPRVLARAVHQPADPPGAVPASGM